MKSLTRALGAVVMATVTVQMLAAQESQVPGPSFKDLLSLNDIGSVSIAPDGHAVAYTVQSTDWDQNAYDTEIWLVRDDEAPFQLTRTEHGSSNSPAWSPDGKLIAFVADRGNKNQIHLIDPRGGEAWALTDVAEGVGRFAWSPDGTLIAFTRQEPETDADKQRTETYGGFAVEDQEYKMSHLWVVELPPERGVAQPTRLTEGSDFTVSGFAWSPDGTEIAFTRQPDPLINSWMWSDLSAVNVATHEMRSLTSETGSESNPVWSPDGQWIAYQASGPDTTSAFYRNGLLYKMPAAGGAPTRIAADLDEDASLTAWNPGGIYLTAWERTKRRVYRVDPGSGATRMFAGDPDQIFSVDFTRDGRTVALVGRSPTTLDEVYTSPVASYRPVKRTDMTAQIDGWTVGTSEVVSWKSRDGTTIEGVLHKPDGFDPSRKYPLFVIIHGGPTGIDYPTAVSNYVYPLNEWLAKGAIVLRPNYRGSAGYGEEFRSLNVRNLGVGDEWDVLSGVDYLISEGIVDTTRMAAMGWSQGGYISAYLTTTTNRFAAISVGAGISDWMTYYVNTDIHPFTRQYLKATPWDDPDIYAKTSPITYIKQASTPTLIQHGEFDRRVPIPNGYELFQGLRDMGVPTRLIVYKGFGHGITKPKERLAAMWHNWQWFGKYIWGEDIELPLDVAKVAPNGAGS